MLPYFVVSPLALADGRHSLRFSHAPFVNLSERTARDTRSVAAAQWSAGLLGAPRDLSGRAQSAISRRNSVRRSSGFDTWSRAIMARPATRLRCDIHDPVTAFEAHRSWQFEDAGPIAYRLQG